MVQELTSLSEFSRAISSSKVAVVDYFATWCGPCKVIAPTYEKLANQYKQANFYKVDVDKAGDVSKQEGVTAMPTFMIYKDGKKVATIRGANARELDNTIRTHAGAPSADSSGSHNWGAGQTLGSSTAASTSVKGSSVEAGVDAGKNALSAITNLDPSVQMLLGFVALYVLYITFS